MKKLTLEEISKDPNTKILIFQTPTDYAYNENGINFVKKNFAIKNVTNSQGEDIRFVAGEMISNAVMHGNKRNSDKKIEIYCLWFVRKFNLFFSNFFLFSGGDFSPNIFILFQVH